MEWQMIGVGNGSCPGSEADRVYRSVWVGRMFMVGNGLAPFRMHHGRGQAPSLQKTMS